MSYFRVSILGSSPGGEVWSINPVYDPTFEFGSSVDQTALDTVTDAIAALTPGVNLQTLMSSSLAITGARVEVRDDATDALMAISTQVRAAPSTGSGSPLRGAQNALVFSLRTTTPGGSGRGRLYWPAVAMPIDTTLRLSSANVTSITSEMKTYLGAIRSALVAGWAGGVFNLAVRSKTTKTTPHVNKLQAGNVLDTQRRRRDSMIEDYVSVTIP